MVPSPTLIGYDIASRIVIETCSVEFEENDGSQVGQVGVCDVGDEMLQEAIGRMGIGLHHPIEVPLMVDREGLCSTQVEPSPSQDQHASSSGPTSAPTQEHVQDPQPNDQVAMQDSTPIINDASQD